ncbi:hypothetical protein J6590_076016 [Homalodisca vitripennis]|nr:hypothetical protein J6590_076016 [Homalodisca vitripennis]
MWAETPIPMYFKIYMFNWTNPSTSLHGPDKPAFTQLGPYVFTEHHSKKNVTYNDNNDTITYLNQKQWHFIPEMSNGTLSDKVTNLNVVAMTVGWYCLPLKRWERMIVNGILSFHLLNEDLVKTDTVGNLLFDGSRDKLLTILHLLKPYIKTLPDMDKFGWFYKAHTDYYNIKTKHNKALTEISSKHYKHTIGRSRRNRPREGIVSFPRKMLVKYTAGNDCRHQKSSTIFNNKTYTEENSV